MAGALSINIEGLRQTITALQVAGDSRLKEIDMEMAASTEMMATNAKKIFSSNNIILFIKFLTSKISMHP